MRNGKKIIALLLMFAMVVTSVPDAFAAPSLYNTADGIYMAKDATQSNVDYWGEHQREDSLSGNHPVYWDAGGNSNNGNGTTRYLLFEVDVDTEGWYELEFRWFTRENNSRRIKINDGDSDILYFIRENAHVWEDVTYYAYFNQGSNTVRLWFQGNDEPAPNNGWLFLDYMKVVGPANVTQPVNNSGIYLTKNAVVSNITTTVATGNDKAGNALGGEYLNEWSANSSVTFNVNVPKTGEYEMLFRYYATSTAGTRALFINGSAVNTLSFSATNNNWNVLETTAVLEAGDNTVTLTHTGSNAETSVRLDYLRIGKMFEPTPEGIYLVDDATINNINTGFGERVTAYLSNTPTYWWDTGNDGSITFTVYADRADLYDLSFSWWVRHNDRSNEWDNYRELIVNGKAEALYFDSNGNNSERWDYQTVKKELVQGANTITLKFYDSKQNHTDGWNGHLYIDHLKVSLSDYYDPNPELYTAAKEMTWEWLDVYLKDYKNGAYATYAWSDNTKTHNVDNNTETGFWQAANVYEVLNDAYEYTQNPIYKRYMDGYRTRFLDGSFSWSGEWKNNYFSDDLFWWSSAFLRTYLLTGDESYLELSEAIFNRVWSNGWDTRAECPYTGVSGGIMWQYNRNGNTPIDYGSGIDGRNEKNVATNGNGVLIAARLSQAYTALGDPNKGIGGNSYAEIAEMIYEWMYETLVADKATGRLLDNYQYNPDNGSSTVRDWQYSYNYGLFAGAAYEMWVNTGNSTYLDHAKLILGYGWDTLTMSDNLTFKNEGGMDGGDGASFRLVLARSTGHLVKESSDFTSFMVYLQANAYQAYNNRRDSDGLVSSKLWEKPLDHIRIPSPIAAFGVILQWYSDFDPSETYGFEDELITTLSWGEGGIYLSEQAIYSNINFTDAYQPGAYGYSHPVWWNNGGNDNNPNGTSRYLEFVIDVDDTSFYDLEFHWYTRGNNTRHMSVNGGETIILSFERTNENVWEIMPHPEPVLLNAGTNKIRIWYNQAGGNTDSWIFIDYMKISPTSTDIYTITYDANGGNGTMDSAIALDGRDYQITANAFSNIGYAFTGWNTEADGSGDNYADEGTISNITDDITLYAQWELLPVYTITYDANGGDGTMVSATVIEGDNYQIEANVFTYTGYTFTGWNTEADGSGDGYAGEDTINDVTDDITLYAQWDAIPVYTITYDANGGDGIMASVNVLEGDNYQIEANVFTYTGYAFAGWNTEADGSGINYTDEGTISNVISDITLYAQWNAIPVYTITYDANDGDGTMNAMTVLEGEVYQIEVNAFTRTGYIFTGWNTEADGSGDDYADEGTISNVISDITLYAQWEIISYTVTWDTDGGTPEPTQTSVNHGSAINTPAGMTKIGHVFDGWYMDYEFMTAAVFPITNVTADMTLWAKWTELPKYTVTYDGNGNDGGIAPEDINSPHYSGLYVTVLGNTGNLALMDNTFAGWNTEMDGSGTAYAEGASFIITEDITLYAQWVDIADIVDVLGVTLDEVSMDLTVGETGVLTAVVLPFDATNKAIIWSSSDSAVATVSGGVVTAVGEGVAEITVTTVDGVYTAACLVTVVEPIYTITATAGFGGSISPSGIVEVNNGADQTFSIIPDTDYSISDVIVDNVSVGAVSSYTFSGVNADHTISAVFHYTGNYTITASAGFGGGISPSGNVTLNSGADQIFYITPNTNYSVSDVIVDNVSVGAVSSYMFSNVNDNHTISVTFHYTGSHTITATAGFGGGISPFGIVPVNNGGSQIFYITPSDNYSISDVIVDNISVGAVSSYMFSNVISNHTISVTFYYTGSHTIIASAGYGGSISPYGNATVNNGGSQTYYITPNSNYSISNVIVDNVSIGAVSSYTFSNVTSNHTISATFFMRDTSTPSPISTPKPTPTPVPTATPEATPVPTPTPTQTPTPKPAQTPAPASASESLSITVVMDVTEDDEGEIVVVSFSDDELKTLVENVNKAENSSKGNDKAVVDVIVDTNGDGNGNDAQEKTVKTRIEIPNEVVSAIATETKADVKLDLGQSIITFDNKALNTINDAADNGNVVISAEKLDVTTLPENIQKTVGNRPVFDFSVKAGEEDVSHFGGGKASINIPYTLQPGENPNAVVVYYIDSANKLKAVRCKYDVKTQSVSFTVTHFSKYAVAHNVVTFNDVPENAWFSTAVGFIAAREITTGVSEGMFAPDQLITRGQFIVMLLKAYNIEPDIDSDDNFTDAGDTYYTDYLAAAKRLGISNGVGDNMFAPEAKVTRQEMYTLLYNALSVINELPEIISGLSAENYVDLDDIASWALPAMTHMVEAGITSGTGNMMLSPNLGATRANMATALYTILSK